MEPEQRKRHGADECREHAQNGKLHDAAGTETRCQHDESSAAREVVQQKRRRELSDESCRKQHGGLYEKLGNAENADDGAGVGGNEQARWENPAAL